MTQSVQDTTPFCTSCDYNLTGLTEDRCPECGTVFDRDALHKLRMAAPRPISASMAACQMIWPPVVFALLGYLLAMSDLEWLYAMLIVCIGVYAFAHAVELAQRSAATLSMRAGGSPYPRGSRSRLILVTILLALLQWTITYAGCTMGAVIGHATGKSD